MLKRFPYPTRRCIMVGKKVVSVVLLMVLALTAIPLNGFAAPVNKTIAGDPAAVDAAIEAMNLPDMPDELAAELRGENLLIVAQNLALRYGPMVIGYFSRCAASAACVYGLTNKWSYITHPQERFNALKSWVESRF